MRAKQSVYQRAHRIDVILGILLSALSANSAHVGSRDASVAAAILYICHEGIVLVDPTHPHIFSDSFTQGGNASARATFVSVA